MSESLIPTNWAKTKIGGLFEFCYGKALSKSSRSSSGSVPVYGSNGITGYHDEALIEEPCLLVGRKGAAGKVSKSLGGCWPIDTTYYIQVPEGLDFEFCYYLFLVQRFEKFEKSTAIPSLSRDDAYEQEIAIPPLTEQRRIVGKVEELFSELDEGVSNLKQARAQLAVYRQALLKHAFEGHLTADWRSLHQPVATVKSSVPHPIESWRFTTLADLTEYITSGSRGWAEFYADAGPIFIRAANLNRDHLDLSDVAFVSLPKGVEGTRTRTRLGDVFITITGANVTKAGFLDHDIGEAYVSQHVALCRPTDPTISEYLYLYIISNAGGRRDLEKAAYGAGKPGLNLDNLRTLKIPMPTRAEIPLIVEAIRSQLFAVDALEADIDLNLQKAEALRQSILKKAFAGELVPQDPADEPAAALLARLRAEREAAAAQSAKKKPATPRRAKA